MVASIRSKFASFQPSLCHGQRYRSSARWNADERASSAFEAAAGEHGSAGHTSELAQSPESKEEDVRLPRQDVFRGPSDGKIVGPAEESAAGRHGSTPDSSRAVKGVAVLGQFQAQFMGLLQVVLDWLRKLPAWQRQRHLRRLQQESNDDPTNADKNARFLAQLNEVSPLEVIQRVDSGDYYSNSAVVVEYIKALVHAGQLTDFANDNAMATAAGHCSLPRLLQDLQVQTLQELLWWGDLEKGER